MFVIDVLILVVLVDGGSVAVLVITGLRPLVQFERLRIKSLLCPCLLPLDVVRKTCLRSC